MKNTAIIILAILCTWSVFELYSMKRESEILRNDLNLCNERLEDEIDDNIGLLDKLGRCVAKNIKYDQELKSLSGE